MRHAMYYSADRKSQGHSWQEIQARDQSRYPKPTGYQVGFAVRLSEQHATSQHARLGANDNSDCAHVKTATVTAYEDCRSLAVLETLDVQLVVCSILDTYPCLGDAYACPDCKRYMTCIHGYCVIVFAVERTLPKCLWQLYKLHPRKASHFRYIAFHLKTLFQRAVTAYT